MSQQLLQQLGFSEKEAEVYILLNKLGPTAASTLARLAGINRTTIYSILNKLEEKQLILQFRQNNTVFYALDDVKKLISREREQLSVAIEVAEELKKMQGGRTIDIKYYRGKEGIKELLEDIVLDKPKVLCSFINSDMIHEAVGESFMKDWIGRRIDHNIFARLILEDCESSRLYKSTDAEGLRETKICSKPFSFLSGYYLYEDNMCFFDFSEQMLAVKIQSVHIAKMSQLQFDTLWEVLK